jgi:UDP-perosamine 4-acetyltransferase
LVVIGAGGHAKVVVELARSCGFEVMGCLDADDTPRLVVGAPVIGKDEMASSLLSDGVRMAALGIGNNRVRQRIAVELEALGFALPALISPNAVVSPSAEVERGAIVMPGAVLNAECHIGPFSIVNTSASVDHDCRLGTAVHVAPGSRLAGSVVIGDRAMIGVGSAVAPEVSIGADATLGAGATAILNIPPKTIAVGTPARARTTR